MSLLAAAGNNRSVGLPIFLSRMFSSFFLLASSASAWDKNLTFLSPRSSVTAAFPEFSCRFGSMQRKRARRVSTCTFVDGLDHRSQDGLYG